MKFVFVSHGIPPTASSEIEKLIGKKASQTKILFVTTPANTYTPEPIWLTESKQELINFGYQITLYDIEKAYKNGEDIKSVVNNHDAILISGGNTFYFLYWANKTGLKEILYEFLNHGGVYIGESSGVVCQIKDLEPIKSADDPDKAPGLINEGMQLTNLIILPHWGDKRFEDVLVKIKRYYEQKGFKPYLLRNKDIMITDGDDIKVIRF